MNALKAIRISKGIKQNDLAEMLNVGQSTVSMWESGESNPTADKLPLLAQILKCSIDDLFGEKERKEEQ